MSLNTPIKEDIIQEQILQAAKRLFAIYGVAKVTMDDVAKAVGKGRSSLYYYYKSKDEILDGVINLELSEVRAAMKKAIEKAVTVEQKISAFYTTKLKVVREKGPFFRTLESGMDADTISYFSKAKIVHHEQTLKFEGALMMQILKDGIAKGELRTIDEKDMESLIFVLLSSLHGLKSEMRLENNVRNIEPVVAQLTRLLMRGLIK
ncbi:TetR/AcrR family transcriptional regulator [Taibaiella lutea]|uniref:TetR/AcrR family transcriptional regulator n=1 Tax=Taibaiella lutea TaxID=2608001 RepID=A0A5M6CE87_9BACT|nr:TetR/AcrR family transcriptional regulator [Taibaiella lutea]KAA5533436.1 TetR/AcrR family transcriptional regulator [Taibaiella lutea]